jgi:hypothetical protein
MKAKYLFSAELFDIIKNDDGWYFKSITRDYTEGPFDTVAGMAKKMAEHFEASIKYAWHQKHGETPP